MTEGPRTEQPKDWEPSKEQIVRYFARFGMRLRWRVATIDITSNESIRFLQRKKSCDKLQRLTIGVAIAHTD